MLKHTSILLVSLLLILAVGLFVVEVPKAHSAAVIYDPLEFLNEFIIRPVVRKIANALENKLLNKINKLISNIDNKAPSFITNWRNYTLDSQARGNDVFRSVLADASLCPYLKNNLRRAFGADKYIGTLAGSKVTVGAATVFQQKTNIPGLPSFQNSANCTLPSNTNIDLFKQDFAKGGGWVTWNQLIKPQNNFFGTYSLALGEQERQVVLEEKSASDESLAGSGFLSQKLGLGSTGSSGLGPTGCVGQFANTRCTFLGKVVTPAEILGQTAVNSLDTKLKRVGGASYLTDILLSLFAAVVDGTTSRIANFAAQNTFDKPPAPAGPVPGIGSFNEIPPPGGPALPPNGTDPNYDSQVKQIQQNTQNACVASCLANQAAGCPPPPTTGPDTCRQNAQTTCDSQCAGF